MKTKKLYLIAAVLLPLLMTSCDENAQFRGELYKKVIYLLSTDDYTFESEHELGVETTGYVTVYCGGTEHIDKDVMVTLEYDTEALSEYNHMYFDIDESRYAHELDPNKYTIESMQTMLRADSPDNYALLPIKIRPDGLSPDSTYLIPLRIKATSDYEVNPDKQKVLFRVLLKNKYATMVTTTYYQVTGIENRQLAAGDVAGGISVTRIFAPLSKNQVRCFAGTNTYNPSNVTKAEIDKYAMTLTINDDNSITITPYGSLEVEMLGGANDNHFSVNARGNYVFDLHYRYKDVIAGETAWIEMTETCVQRR
ncbi:MAG: DUF4361 domain-containing protein [Muribaculaceae bacterium]|nr:DUF4361 domain-containing protein [Muribaculaceae bacterium]